MVETPDKVRRIFLAPQLRRIMLDKRSNRLISEDDTSNVKEHLTMPIFHVQIRDAKPSTPEFHERLELTWAGKYISEKL